jgi:stage III sporulation protein AB
MTVKILGAALILGACGCMGISLAGAHRQKERMLQQLIHAVEWMSCELQYRQTALPQLLLMGAEETTGVIRRVFTELAQELEGQLAPDAACCMAAVLARMPKMPANVREKLLLLGRSMGRFDLSGQLSGLEAVSQLCKRDLGGLLVNRDARIRSYVTLGLCAGIALVILFV